MMFIKFTKDYLSYEKDSCLKVNSATKARLLALEVVVSITEEQYVDALEEVQSEIAKNIAKAKEALAKKQSEKKECKGCKSNTPEETVETTTENPEETGGEGSGEPAK